MPLKEEISQQAAEINKGTYGEKIMTKAKAYKTGAIVGGICGLACAFIFKGKMVLYGVIGAVAGGYIGYRVVENVEEQPEFKNYGDKDKK